MPLRIVARHRDFIVVAKPAGLSFHAEDDGTGLMALARQATGIDGLHPVHRLDRITSGLVLLARSAGAARVFGEMFAAGEIEKYYLALSARKPAKTQGWVRGAMVKGRSGSWRLAREGVLSATTRFFSFGIGPDATPARRLFVLRPGSGRTHQLRVALKSLGSPILGDTRYGGEPADRGYLHAWALRFGWHDGEYAFVLPPDAGVLFAAPVVTARIAAIGLPWELPCPKDRPGPGHDA